jgi:hypothetical protein
MIMIDPVQLGVANVKFILLCVENMLGLKINFMKSEALVTGVRVEEQRKIADDLNCKLWAYPMHYLGLPVSDKRLSVADWLFLTEKVGHRVDPW